MKLSNRLRGRLGAREPGGWRRTARIPALALAAALVAGVAAGCSSSSSSTPASTSSATSAGQKVTLSFWTWVPNIAAEVKKELGRSGS